MSDDSTRKAYARSWGTELELGTKKSHMTDDQRIEIIMGYLRGKARQSCHDTNNRKEQTCHCLSCLDGNDTSLNAVALYIFWFSELQKTTQQLIIMEKIRGAQLLIKNKRHSNDKLYFLPYKTELTEVTEALGDLIVCQYAIMALLRVGKAAWEAECFHDGDAA
jgi:hypothetical protein